MKKIFVEPHPGINLHIDLDGITYEFCIENFENIDSYAPIMIVDGSTGERYHSIGYLELNGHVFVSHWKKDYDYNRDNWICTHDLVIEVD